MQQGVGGHNTHLGCEGGCGCPGDDSVGISGSNRDRGNKTAVSRRCAGPDHGLYSRIEPRRPRCWEAAGRAMTASKVAECLEACTGPIEGYAAGWYSVRRAGSASYPVRPAGPAPCNLGVFSKMDSARRRKHFPIRRRRAPGQVFRKFCMIRVRLKFRCYEQSRGELYSSLIHRGEHDHETAGPGSAGKLAR